MSGLFSVDPNTVIVVAIVIGVVQWAVHVLKRAVDLWFDTVEHHRRPELLDEYDDLEDLADSVRDDPAPYVGFDATAPIAPENEPSWDEKAPLKLIPYHYALAEQAVVVGGNPARFDLTVFTPTGGAISDTPPETPEETSGRHARVEGDDTATGLMPAVDDEPAVEEVSAR